MTSHDHDWLIFERYLSILDRWIDRACTCFVDDPRIAVPEIITPTVVRVHGDLLCKGGLVIHIDNYLEPDRHDRVRGTVYRYHAQFLKPPLRRIFRYDNDHVHKREWHADVFDDWTWREISVEHVGREQFPTLQEVIEELYDWWLQRRDDPLIYP